MALHNPPFYRYPLLASWDKEIFDYIKELAGSKRYPKLIGTTIDKNKFISLLIHSQKSLHDWRDYLIDTFVQIKKSGSIDAVTLIAKYASVDTGKEDPAWATYPGDKIVSKFMDEIATRNVAFVGTDSEFGEFILRYALGQLSNDWESTILMIREMLADGDTLNVRDLNNEMKNFDYLHLF